MHRRTPGQVGVRPGGVEEHLGDRVRLAQLGVDPPTELLAWPAVESVRSTRAATSLLGPEVHGEQLDGVTSVGQQPVVDVDDDVRLSRLADQEVELSRPRTKAT
jgi:hypothetical protein